MPMDFKKAFGYDEKKADAGVWIDIADGISIKIAKLGTVKYQEALMRYTRRHQAIIRLNRLDPKMMADITANTLADSILLDWKGVIIDDIPIDYNRDNAYKMLKEYPDFRTLVENNANDASNFQDDAIDLEVDTKNLPITSNGP